ncbi:MULTISPECIES: hypothetical protein [Thermodesulfobacterium]|jgi:hypothetical protein|uniref:hypothetical protein n=1 Tax=Thermodesulfobacterium TaxID=1740 RepID=UPI00074A4C98|nr:MULTISPECIES: hypothetical protein [Thermodesulfobacterium]KUJ97143.1 MAG: hypothetical protein XD42_1203 [Thermodesulfobacterium sp. 37_54]KUK37347.1 MAG: hypothetical protein XD67_1359 [Thermodesulfobacterium commune]MBZ4681110.1 hypothetical protein [Thermodesulfobacterium sp.]MDK2862202.1 hypothetical protein [Thermodesulfobacterium sp.]MDN5379106.1 hypothetical protein [Thermodesulfobacterium sp.]
MPQNSLNFTILRTNENLTSRSGFFVDAFIWFKQRLQGFTAMVLQEEKNRAG